MTDNNVKMQISIIVAVARNLAIGLGNDLLWHIPEDFKWFKKHTKGHPVIMGRNTYLSLPIKPLPGRKNIIITDKPDDCFTDCVCVGSVEESVKQMDAEGENFIIGGGSIYRQFLPMADRLYLTIVDKDYEADVFFPAINFEEWAEEFSESHPAGDDGTPGFTFYIYNRR